MTTQADPQTLEKGRLTGRHVLFILLGFFGVLITVNSIFVFSAVKSFPGEDVPKSYLQGLSYNDTLAAREAQAALGWVAQAGTVDLPGGPALLVRLSEADGAPLIGLEVQADLRGLAREDADRTLTLIPSGPGEYAARLEGVPAGIWEARIHVSRPDEDTPAFSARKRLTVE
mgnify:FL=1